MEWKTMKAMLEKMAAEICRDYCKYADIPEDIHQEICERCPLSVII